MTVSLMHPASRGSAHIQSSNPSSPPIIDAAFFKSPHDLEMAKQGISYLLALSSTEAFKNVVAESLSKNEIETAKKEGSKDPVGEYCRKNIATTFHYIGTASMLPRDKDGVVDPDLKVYGTSNLRVVCFFFSFDL